MAGRALLGEAVQPHPKAGASGDAPSDLAIEAAAWAGAIAGFVRHSLRDEHVWLAIVAFTTVFPTIDEHLAVRRRLALAEPGDELAALLESLEPVLARATSLDSPIELVSKKVVIDANFSGRFDHNTGVQRVLRETVSRWAPDHDLRLAAWNDSATALRLLVGREPDRVLQWPAHSRRAASERGSHTVAEEAGRPGRPILVPVDCVIVEIEVAQVDTAAPLAALAAVSGNRVVIVGHDMIPIVSAHSQDPIEIERFARFLTVVKNSTRLAGVSRSAAAEFAGYTSALSAQGIEGPTVIAVPLAMNAPSLVRASAAEAKTAGAPVSHDPLPLIVVVGSQEPRKNHFAILFAAERLWIAGERFRLRFIGGGGARHLRLFDAEIARLQSGGHPVEVVRQASDDVVVQSYATARFTVFPSLHEGFGLPVAESLALGTPVITSNHGSLAEAANGGGCLQVDARDDEALGAAMSALLNDDALYERLRGEALTRASRTWNDYAAELWDGLVAPHLAEPAAEHVRRGAGAAAGESAAPSDEQLRYQQLAFERWVGRASAALAQRQARERSLVRKVGKIVPLTRFFVARSREMGVVPAGKAAIRIVKRRAASR
ncbi:MAG: glycosyltransferase family 1 protein [Subtercola sp.]|nr:glycosyltransferase family 1 protein [Subtercola sp.]